MDRAILLIVGLVLSGTQLDAKQLIIETDESALLIRCIDQFGFAKCEMIFESKDKFYECIAFDTDRKPIATGVGSGGSVMFAELDAAIVADVKCR
jgi:hypothetical protein